LSLFSIVQASVVVLRRFKLDLAALITMTLYLVVMLVRFIRCFITWKRTDPIQIGINIICGTLISATVYFFVFEMQLVRILLERSNGSCVRERDYSDETVKLVKRNKLLKYAVIGLLLFDQGVIYTTMRMLNEYGTDYGTTGKVFFYLSVFLKLPLDVIALWIFCSSFLYFVRRKQQSLKREALGFSPFNHFILIAVALMVTLRIFGSLFTVINAVITLSDLYDVHSYVIFRLISGNIIFPLRDFVEALFFSYLFFYQSKVKLCPKSLSKINSQYLENLSQQPAALNTIADSEVQKPKESQFR